MASAASDNPSLCNVLSELFDCVVQQRDSSVVKAGVSLGQFVCSAEDSNPRVQARYEATMEEMRAVSGQWGNTGHRARTHTPWQLCTLFTSAHSLCLFTSWTGGPCRTMTRTRRTGRSTRIAPSSGAEGGGVALGAWFLLRCVDHGALCVQDRHSNEEPT